MTDIVDDFLAHYGVKGMRWGVIRQKLPSSKKSTPKKSESASGEAPKKSHYRQMTEAQYLKAGYSRAEAERRADKSIRIQKHIALAAGLTVAAVGTYVAAQHLGKEFTGVHIKQGTTLQHISKSDQLGLTDSQLYTTFKKADKFNYQGTFAAELGALSGNKTYAIKLATTKAIKAPSNKQGRKILEEALGKPVSPAGYRNFINSFYNKSFIEGENYGKFKSTLASKGFNAVIDTTDQNTYAKAFKPIIVFNSGSTMVEKGSRALSTSEVSKKLMTTRISQMLTSTAGLKLVGLGAATAGAISAYTTADQHARINHYYKTHPGSNLSRAEIAVKLELV